MCYKHICTDVSLIILAYMSILYFAAFFTSMKIENTHCFGICHVLRSDFPKNQSKLTTSLYIHLHPRFINMGLVVFMVYNNP